MSLTVPITTAQVSGTSGYVSSGNASAAPVQAGPVVSANVGTSDNNISIAAAGWVTLGVVVLVLLEKWGFRVAHVPV